MIIVDRFKLFKAININCYHLIIFIVNVIGIIYLYIYIYQIKLNIKNIIYYINHLFIYFALIQVNIYLHIHNIISNFLKLISIIQIPLSSNLKSFLLKIDYY